MCYALVSFAFQAFRFVEDCYLTDVIDLAINIGIHIHIVAVSLWVFFFAKSEVKRNLTWWLIPNV